MPSILIPSRSARTVRPLPHGGQPGNQNAAKPKRASTFLHMRVYSDHKNHWIRAANLAVKRGEFKPDPRGNLAGWVIARLNCAAETEAATRKK